ncbi:Gfo/Idh/MocA family protein [Aeoliella sp. SH292]|uniref:Gfo/Idh/MocA family protein n=1 Tax=Aeoliella sp. SH292 TaxID=3454464 RepID=UPI003F949F0E
MGQLEAAASSRRSFLKEAGAIAVAAPYVVPASVFGKDAPSNRVNVGFIGLGNQGFFDLGSFLRQSNCQVVAVSDVNRGSKGYKNPNDVRGLEPGKKMVEEFYAKNSPSGSYKGCEAYPDFRNLIARDDIDAVVIVVPDHWHETMTIAAAEAGKDIYCEKPLGLTIAGQKRMVEAVRKHNRILQTGSHERSNPLVRDAVELVRSGKIGEVKRVVAHVGLNNKTGPGPGWKPMPVPEGFDYEMWLGPAPDAPYHADRCLYNFRFLYDYSGGQVTNFGAHSLDIAQWGLGMDDSGPVEVEHVYADYLPKGSLFDTATHTGFRCKYKGGVTLDCMTGVPSVRTTFFGTEGVVSIDAAGQNPMVIPQELTPKSLQSSKGYHSNPDHAKNFLACVQSRKEPNAPVEVGHRSATVCHLGNIAMHLRTRLKWDPVAEEFTGARSAEANRLLDREARIDWQS